MKQIRQDRYFDSEGLRCAAWLYLPENLPESADKPPLIIMGHGIAAERSFGLPAFAERFAQEGWAVLLFDYRYLGDSEGEPRGHVLQSKQRRDWQAAIRYARTLSEIDHQRIAIWGSSFGGGHVLATAAVEEGLCAAVSQVPHVDSFASMANLGPGMMLWSSYAGVRDLLQTALFGKPFYVPAIAAPGERAIMNTPESLPGYSKIVPENSGWKNRVPGRFFVDFMLYRPISMARKIDIPVLLVGARHDSLVPVEAVRKTAEQLRHGSYVELDSDHFQPYNGEVFEENIAHQIRFLHQQFNTGNTL